MTTIWDLLVQQFLVVLAAASAAVTVAVTARQVALAPRGGKALAAYRDGGAAPVIEVDINAALGLVKPAYARYLYLGAVATVVVLLLLAGMPLAPALGGGALAYVLADEFLKGGPRKARLAIEQELPTFVSRLGGMLLVTGSPRAAVEEITATLIEGKPLRTWLERLLAGWQAQGEAFLAQAHLEANQISPLLGLTVYQIRRLAETGGAGAAKAFATTAEELSAILEARAVAGAKAEGARPGRPDHAGHHGGDPRHHALVADDPPGLHRSHGAARGGRGAGGDGLRLRHPERHDRRSVGGIGDGSVQGVMADLGRTAGELAHITGGVGLDAMGKYTTCVGR